MHSDPEKDRGGSFVKKKKKKSSTERTRQIMAGRTVYSQGAGGGRSQEMGMLVGGAGPQTKKQQE